MENKHFLKELYLEGKKYIFKGWSLYKICYNKNSGFHVEKLYTKYGGVPLAKRGYMSTTGDVEWVNKVVGFELLKGEA